MQMDRTSLALALVLLVVSACRSRPDDGGRSGDEVDVAPLGEDELGADVAACTPGASRHRNLGLGSQSITVVGPDKADCVVDVSSEVEGSYGVERCRVPRKMRVVRIATGDEPGPAPGTCTQVSHGNVFDDLKNLQFVVQINVPGTKYVMHAYTANAGAGPMIVAGSKVTLQLSVWTDVLPDIAAATLDDKTAAIAGRSLNILVGIDELGPSVDQALIDRNPPLHVGGERRFSIRKEAASKLISVLEIPPPASDSLVVRVVSSGPKAPDGPYALTHEDIEVIKQERLVAKNREVADWKQSIVTIGQQTDVVPLVAKADIVVLAQFTKKYDQVSKWRVNTCFKGKPSKGPMGMFVKVVGPPPRWPTEERAVLFLTESAPSNPNTDTGLDAMRTFKTIDGGVLPSSGVLLDKVTAATRNITCGDQRPGQRKR
jgi:hypothetical protein